MNIVKVSLNKMNDIRDFTNECAKCAFDVELRSGKYVVDAKSIMGIFSLDLSKPIECTYECDCETFREALRRFEVKEK